MGKHYAEKADAGEAILSVVKLTQSNEPVTVGSYRGFAVELYFDAFFNQINMNLHGEIRHRVSLGSDARGNLLRMDNVLSGIPERLQHAEIQLTNLENQREAAKAELGKPFPQAEELAAKSARLAELDAQLNMEDRTPEHEQEEPASMMEDLKRKSGEIQPPRKDFRNREEER